MNIKRLQEITDALTTLGATVRLEIQSTRIDDAVIRCAMLECERQERAVAAVHREIGLWGGFPPRTTGPQHYACPMAGCSGANLPFASSAALFVHLMRCPRYRAEIQPALERPMGVPDAVRSAERDLVGIDHAALRTDDREVRIDVAAEGRR